MYQDVISQLRDWISQFKNKNGHRDSYNLRRVLNSHPDFIHTQSGDISRQAFKEWYPAEYKKFIKSEKNFIDKQAKQPKINNVFKSDKPLPKGSRQHEVNRIVNNPEKFPKLTEREQQGEITNNETISRRGYVLPGFRYLGPGNSLNRGEPTNQIDADAQKHDNQYNQASTSQHIKTADTEFTHKAIDHVIEGISGKGSISNTIGGIVGSIGIGAKNLLESKTGILYPNISGKYGCN